MRTTVPTLVVLLLAGCGSVEEPVPEDESPEGSPASETAVGAEDQGPQTVPLDEPYEQDGFTIEITDLRREVEEDGFNATTGEEGELPYAAWRFEITNGTGSTLHTGSTTSACYVGDPLEEAEQPVLGESVNPPDQLADGQSATWDADCWMNDDQSQLQYTLEFWDEDGIEPTYAATFAGEVPE